MALHAASGSAVSRRRLLRAGVGGTVLLAGASLPRVSAPVRDRDGRCVAAVNVSAHASRTSLEAMRRELLPPLLTTAARIEADLRATARPHRR